MPDKRRRNWAVRNPAATYGRSRGNGHRPLRGFELLEDRRLLATITVNTLVDENNGVGVGGISLREAVAAAASNDTIMFSVTGTINLTSAGSGHIIVNKNLTIQGPGANLLTIKAFDPDANGANDSDGYRAFLIDNNDSSLLNVTIRGLTFTNGDPEGDSDTVPGGAIFNRENLTINNCVITGNYSPNGGGIYSRSGTLTVVDTIISANASQDGGGILLEGGTVTLTRVQLTGNVATNVGGGLLKRGGTLTVTDSTISGNQGGNPETELSGLGGGIAQYDGNLTVNTSTISGNSVGFHGGGIYISGGNLTVASSTISGNSAGINAQGGGIYSNTSNTIHISHSTITGNSVPSNGSGAGIRSVETAVLEHTIVAGNVRGNSPDDVSGSFDASYSLIGDRRSASVTNIVGSLIGTTASPINAMLGPLANNAGPTMTHTLLVGSPAIDSGNMSAVAGAGGIPQFDQRGMPYSRIANGDGAGGARIDMGAVEILPPAPALPGDYNRNNVVDAADYILWRKTQGAGVPQYSGADGDGNGMVEAADYGVWRAHFGAVFVPPATGASATSASLPSPAESAPDSAANASDETALFASAAPRSTNKSLAAAVFESESPTSALDLLLTLEPDFSPSAANHDSSMNGRGDSARDDGPALDVAFEEGCNAFAEAVRVKLGGF